MRRLGVSWKYIYTTSFTRADAEDKRDPTYFGFVKSCNQSLFKSASGRGSMPEAELQHASAACNAQLLKDHLFTILYFNVAGSVPGLLVTIRHLLAAPHLLTHTPLPIHVVSARSISLSAASCTRGQLPHLFSSRLAGLAKLPVPFLGLPPRQHINPSSVQLNHLFPNSKCRAYHGIRPDFGMTSDSPGIFLV